MVKRPPPTINFGSPACLSSSSSSSAVLASDHTVWRHAHAFAIPGFPILDLYSLQKRVWPFTCLLHYRFSLLGVYKSVGMKRNIIYLTHE
jgi:hypothetical protein